MKNEQKKKDVVVMTTEELKAFVEDMQEGIVVSIEIGEGSKENA